MVSGVTKVTLRVRGYCSGAFQIKTSWDGPVLGERQEWMCKS